MRINLSTEIDIKKEIERILKQMCSNRSTDWHYKMTEKIFNTNVIERNCIEDDIEIDEDMIVSALLEVLLKNCRT